MAPKKKPTSTSKPTSKPSSKPISKPKKPVEQLCYEALMDGKHRECRKLFQDITDKDCGYYYRVKSWIEKKDSLENARAAFRLDHTNVEFRIHFIEKLRSVVQDTDYSIHEEIMMLCNGTLRILNKGGGQQTRDFLGRTHDESLKVVVSEMEDKFVVVMEKLFDNGKEAALRELGHLIDKFSYSGICLRFRASILYQTDSLQEAVASAEEAVRWYPDSLEYRAFYAFLLFKGGGEYKEIIEHCEAALKKMDRGIEIDSEIINKIIPTHKKRTDRLRVLLSLLRSKCHKLMRGEEEEKEWVLEWPWPPYTLEWWTGKHKDHEIEALINQERGANLASTSEPEWMVNAQADAASVSDNTKKPQKPKPWNHPVPITKTELNQMRAEFWDNAPRSGGQKEIWDVLQRASEAELIVAQALVDSAGVTISSADLTTCYDERGAKYELPIYVLSDPTNLIQGS